jgi:hypothetical protein
MSANGATEQRSSFQRWVASLKRESQPGEAGAVPATPGARPKRDDDATRVHRVPKDFLLRLQARAAASALESLHAERTAVFRAPPELLERAKGKGPADEGVDPATAAVEELTQPLPVAGASSAPAASAESSPLVEFPIATEAASGISQRPQGLGPRARAEAESAVQDAAAAPTALNAEVEELLSSPPAIVEHNPQGVVASSDRDSEPPRFRQRSRPTLVFIVLLAVAAALLVLALR